MDRRHLLLGAICAPLLSCECGSLSEARDEFCAQRPDVCADGSTPDAGPGDAGPHDAGSQDAGPGTLTGQVTNVQTHGPVPGATVSVGVASATADGAGHYTLPNVPSGPQTVLGTATGYLPRSYGVNVAAGGTTTRDLVLSTAGKLQGTVTSGGAAVQGAIVSIDGGMVATQQSATTDSAGFYQQGYVSIGPYAVLCALPDGGTQTASPTVTTGNTTTQDFSF